MVDFYRHIIVVKYEFMDFFVVVRVVGSLGEFFRLFVIVCPNYIRFGIVGY